MTDPTVDVLAIVAVLGIVVGVIGFAVAFHATGLLAREHARARKTFLRLQDVYWKTLAPHVVIDYGAVKDEVGKAMNDLVGGDEK